MKHDQTIATQIGATGCLALSYIKLAQLLSGLDNYSPLQLLVSYYDELLQQGAMTDEMYILDPVKFIKTIFDLKVGVCHSSTYPQSQPYAIAYNNIHFVVVDSSGDIVWNPLANNDVVWRRQPVKSYRVMEIEE